MKTKIQLFSLALALALPAVAADNSTNSPAGDSPKFELSTIPDASHKPVAITNTVTIAGESVTYRAETGMLPILKDDGTSRASIFYVAYTKIGETNASTRPLTFCFNGGPGSSSVWLHLGAFGPRRVKMNSDGTLPKPPYGLVDNEYSLLNTSDLVFIDPVATGFSRVTKDGKNDEFFGQENDLSAVGEFIRLWTTRHERWLSPKFLCGESYGVFRAAGLAEHMNSASGMYFNGLILISGVLDFGTIWASPGDDRPYALILPAYTASAQYFNKLPPDLQSNLPAALAECRAFARGDYISALFQGGALPKEDRQKVVTELARLTGLKPQLIDDNDLRIDEGVFRKQLLHDEGLILGVYDTRITGRDGDPSASEPENDPSSAATRGPFGAAINSYLRTELKFNDDLPYELLAGVQPWPYSSHNSPANISSRLATTMNQNPYLRLLVLGGKRDLVCPIDSVHYALDHMTLDHTYRTNITYTEYEAGHMMYINQPDLQKMQTDIEGFIKQ